MGCVYVCYLLDLIGFVGLCFVWIGCLFWLWFWVCLVVLIVLFRFVLLFLFGWCVDFVACLFVCCYRLLGFVWVWFDVSGFVILDSCVYCLWFGVMRLDDCLFWCWLLLWCFVNCCFNSVVIASFWICYLNRFALLGVDVTLLWWFWI